MSKLGVLILFISSFWLQTHAGFSSPLASDIKPHSNDQKINGLTVVWWNTACGSHEVPTEKSQLIANLEKLSREESQIDILLLGEYCPSALPAQLVERLKAKFPYSKYVPYTLYNPQIAYIGFGIFSRLPMTVAPSEHLDWLPVGTKAEKDNAEKFWKENSAGTAMFPRSYNRLRVTKAGQDYHLVPVHLAHPWQTYISRWYKDDPILRKAAIATELLFGQENPLVWQLDRLLAKLRRDYAPIKDHRLMLIGDFNFPLRIPNENGLAVLPYRRILANRLRDGMNLADISHRPTKIKIDQAFVTDELVVTKSKVLKILGSDHFPLLIEIR